LTAFSIHTKIQNENLGLKSNVLEAESARQKAIEEAIQLATVEALRKQAAAEQAAAEPATASTNTDPSTADAPKSIQDIEKVPSNKPQLITMLDAVGRRTSLMIDWATYNQLLKSETHSLWRHQTGVSDVIDKLPEKVKLF